MGGAVNPKVSAALYACAQSDCVAGKTWGELADIGIACATAALASDADGAHVTPLCSGLASCLPDAGGLALNRCEALYSGLTYSGINIFADHVMTCGDRTERDFVFDTLYSLAEFVTTPTYQEPPAWAHEMRSVGITGTNGKTSTALLLAAALSDDGSATARLHDARAGHRRHDAGRWTASEFRRHIKSAYDAGERRAVLEMTSLALARGGAVAWPFHGAVFTSFSHDHLNLHANASEYLAAKAQLFIHLRKGGFAVLPTDDEAAALIEEVLRDDVTILRYGERTQTR